jgi:hypothetical protein
MVDGLHTPDNGGNATHVQYKSNQNYHYESPHLANIS